MTEPKMTNITRVASNLNVSWQTIRDYLNKKGFNDINGPNARLTDEQCALVEKEFASSKAEKEAASKTLLSHNPHAEELAKNKKKNIVDDDDYIPQTSSVKSNTFFKQDSNKPSKPNPDIEKAVRIETPKLSGPKVVGKIDLDKSGKAIPKTEANEKPSTIQETIVNPEHLIQEQQSEEIVIEQNETNIPLVLNTETQQTPTTSVIENEVQILADNVYENDTDEQLTDEELDDDSSIEEDTDTVNNQQEVEEYNNDENTATDIGGIIKGQGDKLKGLTVLGKIELNQKKLSSKPVASTDNKGENGKRKRRRRVQVKEEIAQKLANPQVTTSANKPSHKQADKFTNVAATDDRNAKNKDRRDVKKDSKGKREEISQEAVDLSYKKTLADLHSKGNKQATKLGYKEKKKTKLRERLDRDQAEKDAELGILKVTEFITTSDLATLMEKTPSEVIGKCLEIGAFVSINQRLDAEIIKLVAEEFGFDVQFVTAEEEIDSETEEVEDTPESLKPRDPIVTIMGHVDHGKTTLLDFIRKSKVAEGEAGGITQHIGAYDVITNSGRRIVFLDTPGHEAFTAMRARGAKATDVAIIVVAADDNVMPQTIEAINHAQVAGVPFVIAINKIDKDGANPTRIKEQLANKVNVLVEEWGGKVQSQEISAKKGLGIDELLEKVILEADILDLKANPNKNAVGTVIESALDKGRGYVSTVLVQAGTLCVGDAILAGYNYGKVKAMYNHKGEKLLKAIPSTPVQILGFNGAPQAGDKFTVMNSERDAREIALKREQIIREQSIRTTRRVTLSELGRRIALGTYKRLNIILKGDVDGSVEALADSLIDLSTDEIEVNILHKGVGPVTESDVLLAATADAIIIGFQVRPTPSARKIAEREDIEIRLYSIIYAAIDEVKAAMEGMLAPKFEEKIIGNVEVREIFKIRGVGTIAGCMVTDGIVKRNAKVRVVRNGIVIFGGDQGGDIASLKRMKDDVSEVRQGFDCGILIKNFNDLEKGDIIEAFEQTEVKRTLK